MKEKLEEEKPDLEELKKTGREKVKTEFRQFLQSVFLKGDQGNEVAVRR